MQADAAVGPPPGPKKIIVDPPNPDPKVPTTPDPIKVKKSNPNIKKIAQTSVNDLPANYTEKYKSLFLGLNINLRGESMTGYIERAIKEIATRGQFNKFRKYLNGKMKPGWAMYMASLNDSWFENYYKKKFKWWHYKGHRDLKRFEKLKKRQEMGKKLSKRQERLLKEYEEQMRVGRLIMESFRAMNPGFDPNNINKANFSDQDGNVAAIVIEMAEAAGLQVPEIITAENIENLQYPKQPEVQLADLEPDQNSIDNGKKLLEKVQEIESQQAAQAEVAGQAMEKAANSVLAKIEKNNAEKSKVMEASTDGLMAKLKKRREEKSQVMEDAVDRVLDRLEISKKIREMAEARKERELAAIKTDNDYYESIEIEEDPFDIQVKSAQPVSGMDEDYYSEMTYIRDEEDCSIEATREDPIKNQLAEADNQTVGKFEEPDQFDVDVISEPIAPIGTDEDCYAEMTYIRENEDCTIETTRENEILNQLAEVEPANPKPKGLLSRIGGWFKRKAA